MYKTEADKNLILRNETANTMSTSWVELACTGWDWLTKIHWAWISLPLKGILLSEIGQKMLDRCEEKIHSR
jgi:hypothetical protein